MELTYCPCFNSKNQQLMMLNDGKRGIDEEDYELVEYKKGKGIKRKSERKPKGSAKLEVGQCYKFQSMNFPEHYIHNRKGQVWMDKGDFSSANFKQTTTWRVTEGNWNSNGGISISSIELDD